MTIDRFTDDAEPTPCPRLPICSTSSPSTATGRMTMSPIRARCPSRQGSKARSPTCSMRWWRLCPDTRLEPDLQALLWSIVNVFHRRIDRIERELDANETAQRSSQREQDGSEIRSLELERLIAQGLTLIERRNSFEFLRDTAAELYGIHTGQVWRPRTGSMVNHTTLTAAMIDSREFINARRRADAQVLLPKGTRIALRRRRRLQRPPPHLGRARQGACPSTLTWCCCTAACPRGAEKIAACWADTRKVPQVVFKPDWTRHQKAAPFKRNDQLLGSPADRRHRVPGLRRHRQPRRQGPLLGIPLFDFRNSGCGA